MTMLARTGSVEATKELAGSLVNLLRPGDVLLLAGDLGAGKTAFCQGLAAALGVTEPVTSPTFTLARSYEGRLTLHHLDAYRLERLSEIFDVGLPEILDEGGVVVVEWGDAIAPAIPAEYQEVRLRYGEDDDERLIELRCIGTRWQARQRPMKVTVSDWLVSG